MADLEALDRKANPGAFSTFDMAVLVPEVERLEPGEIYLEVGVDKGKSLSVAKMVAKEGVEIWGVDLCKDPKVPGTRFENGDSRIIKLEKKVKVIFIDGDHTYEGVKKDFEMYHNLVNEGGVVVFHDICDHSAPQWAHVKVKQFWDEIKGGYKYHEFVHEPLDWGGLGVLDL